MAKKVVKKAVKKNTKPTKAATKSTAKGSSKKLSLSQRLLHKHHRPLHVATAGALLMFLKSIFLFLGLALVLIGAFVYIYRAARNTM